MPFRIVRKYRRGSRKLNKANILANRSAKAQSKQIAKLNSRVNYLVKANRPEVRNICKTFSKEFKNDIFSSNWDIWTINPWITNYLYSDTTDGSLNIEGNFCKSKGISFKIFSEYTDDWNDSISATDHDASAGYHILIIQNKNAFPVGAAGTTPAITDFFNVNTSLSSDDINICLPLISGISSTYKILYHRVFTINRYRPARTHNIYIPAKKMLNFVKEVNGFTSSNVPKGSVHILFFTGGLHYDTSYSSKLAIHGTANLYFTDN